MRKQTKRAAAVAVAAAMSVITGVSAVPSVAAVSSMMEVATASDARKKATESNAQPETIVSDLAPMEMQVATVSATGDLWNQWIGAKMDWLGSGTKSDPYKITGISELMGLSEAVAQGESFRGIYFELQNNIDLGDLNLNNGSWNPIGWFHNVSDLSGVPKAFEGTFDGAGNTISGLKFTKIDHTYSYLGLFGAIKNATIKNLVLEADEISGQDKIGLLAGSVEGNSTIYGVKVCGVIYADGNAGAIAGEVTGGTKNAVIENCVADQVVLNSEGKTSYVGGIAGNAQKVDVVDCSVTTQDGDTDRIRGKGYVGGILGRQNQANIYNVYVTGTFGGNLTKAVGGITGLYESGNIVTAVMDGEISRTNNGVASKEGAIIGTREARNSYRYGTGKNDQLSYLFISENNKSMVKQVCGSGIADDNVFTYDAHIGYYTDYQQKYMLVAGTKEKYSGDRYFYEELEDGVKNVITQKLGKELTIDYAVGVPFQIDHWAPGNQGEPVKGYLVSIPRIDTKNANGTYDNDVAVLTAISATNNSYYRQIDKDSPSAVAPGSSITVATAAKNTDGKRYQMVYDANRPGKVKPPTYTDENSEKQDMTYVNGGTYSFIMPESDTELNVEYVKVTTALTMTPQETNIFVKQTRSGDRKNPQILTEVRNAEGTLIAKYINGSRDTSVQVLPVTVHAEHNGVGSTADRTISWSIDDTDLLHFEDGWTGGYTMNDARILPNMNSRFIQGIINKKVKEQADGNYQQAIDNGIYTDSAVVTAVTNPETSVDNKAVTGTCKVNVSFQIVDNTTVRVEGMVLNHQNMTFEVVRKLTGDRKNPKEEYVVTEPITLDASLNPSQPFYKNVTWADTESGKILSLTPEGTNKQSCSVAVVYDKNGKSNPAWIQNIINVDNFKKATDIYQKLEGNGTHTEKVTATSEDQTHGVVTSECEVTIKFRTEDQTVIHPETVKLSKTAVTYDDLEMQFIGSVQSAVKSKTGFGDRDTLIATALPELSDSQEYKPYNCKVSWTSSDPDAVTVNAGKLTVNDQAKWIQDALKQPPYQAEKLVVITAATEDGQKQASCTVTLKFQAQATRRSSSSGGSSGGSSSGGGRVTSGTTVAGSTSVSSGSLPSYVVTGKWIQNAAGKWLFTDNKRTYANEWAAVHNPYADTSKGQNAFDWFRFDQNGYMVTGWFTDTVDGNIYYLHRISDGTQGHMYTGWNWIDDDGDGIAECYYFNSVSDGTRGRLYRNTKTPDGYQVNESGQWMENGVVQKK